MYFIFAELYIPKAAECLKSSQTSPESSFTQAISCQQKTLCQERENHFTKSTVLFALRRKISQTLLTTQVALLYVFLYQ